MTADELSCRELVELVTEYLEGTLAPSDRARFEAHVAVCDGCTAYLEQFLATVAAVGRGGAAEADPAATGALLAACRDWKRRA